MPIQLIPPPEQLEAFRLLRDLGSSEIRRIAEEISKIDPPPIRPSELFQALASILPDLPAASISSLGSLLFSLYTLKIQRRLGNDEVMEGLLSGFKKVEGTTDEISKWETMDADLRELLSLESVSTIVKASELAYDYAKVFQNAKIITDIRPIFNEDASHIEGAIISYVLRLYYDGIGGAETLSIALDRRDVENLREACERALKKAETAKQFMQDHGIQRTLDIGSDE